MSDDLLERLGRGCNCGRCKLDLCCCAAMEEAKAEIEKLREAGKTLTGMPVTLKTAAMELGLNRQNAIAGIPMLGSNGTQPWEKRNDGQADI